MNNPIISLKSNSIIFFLVSIWILSCGKINPSNDVNLNEHNSISANTEEAVITKDDNLYLWKLKWYADTTHSSISFRNKHNGVYDVIGWIPSFSIVMEGQKKDFTDVVVEAYADIRTVVMPNLGMAGNLQGMFDTQNHPKAYFKSKRIVDIKGNKYKLIGDMTIKGITKELGLDVKFNGFGNPLDFGVPGFTADGKFNRFDFNIGEPENIENASSPHPLIGDTIYFRGNFRFFYDED